MSKTLSRPVRRLVLLLIAASFGACHFHGGHCWKPHRICQPVRVCR